MTEEQFFTHKDIEAVTKAAGLEEESRNQLQGALEQTFYEEMLQNGQLPENITPDIAEKMIARGKMKAELYRKEEQGREASEQYKAWNTLSESTPDAIVSAVQGIRMKQLTRATDSLIRNQAGQYQEPKAKEQATGILRQGKPEELVRVITTHAPQFNAPTGNIGVQASR